MFRLFCPFFLFWNIFRDNKLRWFSFVLANLYTNVENWPDVKTLPTELGEIGGIALSNGNNELIVFHRGSRKWEYKYVKSHHC